MGMVLKEDKMKGGIRTIVRTKNGATYCVDTADTFDLGPETMIFPYSLEKQEVTDWGELGVWRYADMDTAYRTHESIIQNLDDYLS